MAPPEGLKEATNIVLDTDSNPAAPTPVVVLSSGGKDSMYLVETLRRDDRWRIEALVTTVNEHDRRVPLHGTSEALLYAQAGALDLPLTVIGLPERCDNQAYEARLSRALRPYRERGVETIACGDLFLEDIRRWREQSFRTMGWQPIFPIWHTPTDTLARELTRGDWRIIVTCIDTRVLSPSLLGRTMDAGLMSELPESVDSCGENGEFHTFVSQAPAFSAALSVAPGDKRTLISDRYLSIDLNG